MPARGMVPSDIPVDVLLDATRNPEQFSARLKEFDRRRNGALKAEKEAAQKLKELSLQTDELAEKVREHEERVKEFEGMKAKMETDVANARMQNEKRFAELNDLEAVLSAKENAQNERHNDLIEETNRLAGLKREIESHEKALEADREAVEREKADLVNQRNAMNAWASDIRSRLESGAGKP